MNGDAQPLPGWEPILKDAREALPADIDRLEVVPLAAPASNSAITLIADQVAAEKMAQELLATRLRALAFDTEYTYTRPGLQLGDGTSWHDIRSIAPLLLSVVAWYEERADSTQGYLARYILDLRQAGLLEALARVLRIRVPMVFHDIKPELFALWSLGLQPDLYNIYDTHLAAACLHLGLHHPRADRLPGEDAVQEMERVRKAGEERDHLLSLVGQCRHYGLRYPHSESKDKLRHLFQPLTTGGRVTPSMQDDACADAEFAMRLYAAQQGDLLRQGLDTHLRQVEFPFAVANARIEWNGVQVSADGMKQLVEACARGCAYHAGELSNLGMTNPGSHEQFEDLVDRLHLRHHFTARTPTGRISTRDEDLEVLDDVHPAIRHFRLHQKLKRDGQARWLSGEMIGADGRYHPVHQQLGAHSGRNTCSNPNITGIGKKFRPVVVAPPGKAIIELDFEQIEVGVVAAEYGDTQLIHAYNDGDVYAWMARSFYADELTDAEKALTLPELKAARRGLRNNMKVFVLASLYGMVPRSIASKFGISLTEAETQLERFRGLFPVVARAMADSVEYGHVRGYAYATSGLRRHLEPGSQRNRWTRNQLRNTPIQSSATSLFKRAVIDLDRAFAGTDTKIILPVHDSVVLECRLDAIEDVANRARILMETAVKTYYPALTGKVDVNALQPHCWNKDGNANSIERFLEDPTFTLN